MGRSSKSSNKNIKCGYNSVRSYIGDEKERRLKRKQFENESTDINANLTLNKADDFFNGTNTQTEPKGTNDEVNLRYWKLCSCCLCVVHICIICLLSIEGRVIFAEFVTSYSVDEINNADLIILCDDASLSLDEDEATFDAARVYMDKMGRNVCSFKNLTAAIERVTERASRIRLAKGLSAPGYLSCGNVKKAPAQEYMLAYLTELSGNQTHQDRGYNGLVNWKLESSNSFIGPGISYHNGKIQVNASQFYFVYAYITFDNGIDMSKKGHPGSCLFNLWVFKGTARYAGQYERILLKSTGMLHSAANSTTTQYVGSHVYLRSNEEIYVKVTNTTRLVHTLNGNGFGIFPLS